MKIKQEMREKLKAARGLAVIASIPLIAIAGGIIGPQYRANVTERICEEVGYEHVRNVDNFRNWEDLDQDGTNDISLILKNGHERQYIKKSEGYVFNGEYVLSLKKVE